MSAIGRRKLKGICKQFIEASRAKYGGRKTLLGHARERDKAVVHVQIYQAMMKTVTPPSIPLGSRQAANLTAELRKNALDRKLSASKRCIAIARLMLLEGYEISVHWTPDAVDDLCAKYFSIRPKPTEVEVYTPSVSVIYKRDAARRQAVFDIKSTMREDFDTGRIKSVTDAINYLRLPEQPFAGPAPNLFELDAERLKKILGGHCDGI